MSNIGPPHGGSVGRFYDVVLVARDLLEKQKPELMPPATQPRVEINPKLRSFVESYLTDLDLHKCLNGELYYIKIADGAIDDESISGMLVRGKSGSQILLSGSLTYCWKRFVVCKELMHLYADVESNFADDIVEQVNKAIKSNYRLSPEQELDPEDFCKYLAIEVMLPWKHRSILARMRSEESSFYQIANRFKVPEAIIEQYFMTNYGEVSTDTNKSLERIS